MTKNIIKTDSEKNFRDLRFTYAKTGWKRIELTSNKIVFEKNESKVIIVLEK